MNNIPRKSCQHKRYIAAVAAVLLAAISGWAVLPQNTHKVQAATSADANSTTPCVASPAPAQWKHVVVLMFENKQYSSVIGSSSAPYITNLASKCGTAYSGTSGATPTNNWHDANYKVNGTTDGNYVSKPSYATLTSGVPPTVHGLKDDAYSSTSGVDNIYNRLQQAGKLSKDYYSGSASSTPCASSNFSGAYHDAIRYYSNLGGQSTSTSTYCNTHDVPINPNFMSDVNNGTLPAFSMVLPTNGENMHDNSVASGDTWAQNFLKPLFDSAQYKSGDTAVFFLWDEDTAIPNVLLAPSIVPGSKVPATGGNPISHFSALRTWQEMLGVSPLLGDTGQAPSLLSFFNGGCTPPPPPADNPPAVNMTAPANGTTITTSPVTVSANATDDQGVAKVEFYDGSTLIGSDTTAPYSASWNVSALSGGHSLTAKAFDTANHTTTSATVSVTVSVAPVCGNDISGIADTARIVVNAPTQGTYHVWSRLMAPDSTNNSFYLQVDTACPLVAADNAGIAANAWTWTDYKDGNTASHITLSLAAGNHTITVAKREGAIKLDRFLLLSDSCVPTNTGTNCIDTTAPTVSLTAPAAGSTVSGSVTLSASASDGDSGMAKVDFLVDGNVVGTASTSPYQFAWNSAAVADGSHSLQARATDVAGNAVTSAGVTVTVKNADVTPPSTPTNFQVTKNVYNEVGLQWNPSTDNVGVTGYKVMRGGAAIATVNGTTYSDKSVVANTSYTYTVVALDAAGNQSPASNSLLVTTPAASDTTPPSAPSGLTASATSATQVKLSWTASTDNVGVAVYYVKRGGVVISSVTTPGYTDSNVTPSTAYSYTVVAADAAGNASANSNTATVTTPAAPDTQAPSAPSNLVGTATSAPQVNLTWTASTDNKGVVGYEVWRGGVKLATTATTDFGDATVAAGQTYKYTVLAFDAAGNKSTASNEASVTVPAASGGQQTITLVPIADATIKRSHASHNYGTGSTLEVDHDSVKDILMKFKVSGVSGHQVAGVKLRLYVRDSSPHGGTFFATGNTWTETGVTWNNAPAVSGSSLGSKGAVKEGNWVDVDLRNFITQDGTYSLRVTSADNDGADYSSKEAVNKPKLILTVVD